MAHPDTGHDSPAGWRLTLHAEELTAVTESSGAPLALAAHWLLMARDHIVPQMLLRRFADEGERLLAIPRAGGAGVPMTVKRACREAGFYDVDIAPEFSHLAPRKQIEISLADFEGRASRLFDRFAEDRLDLSDQDRFDLMLFVAFQAVRGWSFREEISELATLMVKEELRPRLTTERLRAQLRKDGRPYDDAAVQAWREELLTSEWKVVPSQSAAVQEMGQLALNVIHPDLYFRRRVRLLRFAKPALLVSDEPVALWVRRDPDLGVSPLGIASADAVYMPIDRRHALALLLSGDERVVDARPKRAETINRLVASGAHRWVFQHPDDPPIEVGDLEERPRWGVETLGGVADGDEIRVQKRIVRHPTLDRRPA